MTQARVCHLHMSMAINTLKARVPVEHLAWRRVELPVEHCSRLFCTA